MTYDIYYKVSWTIRNHAPESRTFAEWEPAVDFYNGLVADQRVSEATLIEVVEKQVRYYEREVSLHR